MIAYSGMGFSIVRYLLRLSGVVEARPERAREKLIGGLPGYQEINFLFRLIGRTRSI